MRNSRIVRSVLSLLIVSSVLVSATWLFAKEQKEDWKDLGPHEQRPIKLYSPLEGFVPDSLTAIRIAEAVWLPIYGKAIYERLPFEADLDGDSIWAVAGTMPAGMSHGGVPYAEIRKSDGRIVGVGHGE